MTKSEYDRQYYEKNRVCIQEKRSLYKAHNLEKVKAGLNANVKRHQKRTKAFIQRFKNKPCLDCGVWYPPYVMDFDHRDPTTKKFSISSMVNLNHNDIELEIEKCDLVCANCHRERTYGRKDNRYQRLPGVDQET